MGIRSAQSRRPIRRTVISRRPAIQFLLESLQVRGQSAGVPTTGRPQREVPIPTHPAAAAAAATFPAPEEPVPAAVVAMLPAAAAVAAVVLTTKSRRCEVAHWKKTSRSPVGGDRLICLQTLMGAARLSRLQLDLRRRGPRRGSVERFLSNEMSRRPSRRSARRRAGCWIASCVFARRIA